MRKRSQRTDVTKVRPRGPRAPPAASTKLRAALDALRAGNDSLCDVTDRCYPGYVEDDWCNIGSLGFERHWPHEEADVCWVPLYQKDAAATLAALKCLQQADADERACLSSCPEEEDGYDCNYENESAQESCVNALTRAVGNALLDASDTCDETFNPNGEEEGASCAGDCDESASSP
jgi:hypothetical protein